MNADQKDRYIRWQGYRIEQMSYSINLFLGFAAASLGYVVNVKLESKPHEGIPIDTVIFWWAACVVLGCIATISKLLDYRSTARKIKDGSEFYDCMATCCGHVTWGSFWGQVVTFTIGAFLFIAGVMTK